MFFCFALNQPNKYHEDPDVQLMLAFQKGDKRAFESLMRKFFPRVMNFVYRYVGSREIAEDLAQEVFIKIFKTAQNYSPQAKLQTWIFTIAKNTTLNELRRLNKKTISLDAPIHYNGDTIERQIKDTKVDAPDQAYLKKEQSEMILKVISELPENQRMAVILRRYENMSYDEIAKAMKTTTKAVKSLLSRAKENLKDGLTKVIE